MADEQNSVADVSPVLTGRHVIYTDASAVDEKNVVQVLNEVLPTFYRNQSEINYLYGYYKGKQPILNRVKDVDRRSTTKSSKTTRGKSSPSRSRTF